MDLDLSTVRKEIHDAQNKWYDIGIELKVDTSTLKAIEFMYSNAKDCLREVISEWLKAVSPKPTWRSLVDALRLPVVDEPKLAAVLEGKYCLDITEGQGNYTLFYPAPYIWLYCGSINTDLLQSQHNIPSLLTFHSTEM